jgi:polysaccharide export outer membrane protein
VLLGCLFVATGAAQQSPVPAPQPGAGTAKPATAPPDYVIGADDVLIVSLFGQDPKYSGEVTVRPDGKITLLLVDEIRASGLTPLQLKAELVKAYAKYFEDPVILVSPKQINSRRVFIDGNVAKPGAYPLNESMTILQLISMAGGLLEFADKEKIVLIRKDPLPNGRPDRVFFNYQKVFEPVNLPEIPKLRPGDQVIVR